MGIIAEEDYEEDYEENYEQDYEEDYEEDYKEDGLIEGGVRITKHTWGIGGQVLIMGLGFTMYVTGLMFMLPLTVSRFNCSC